MTTRETTHDTVGRGEASGIDTEKNVEVVQEVCSVREEKQNLRVTMESKAAIDVRLVE